MTKPIAVQLYSLREELSQDVPGVLKKLADIGYLGVEPYGGLDAPAVAAAAKANGLEIISSHLPMPLGDDAETTFSKAQTYGLKRIVIPFQPAEKFATVADIQATCAAINEANDAAKAKGYTLGYHNHAWEMQAPSDDPRPAYQIMLDNLASDIFFQVDTYWAQVAGLNPAEVVAGLGSRTPLLHIKDGPATKTDPMTAVGAGVVDVPAIVKAGQSADWLIVELDRCATDMMTAIEQSYHYMISKGLAHGK